ncbi:MULTISPECIES: ABC transporter ATP-binding protein [unclassified Variovorax]|uniref:ABC transporter ATP-binding protein n=1 Tax=unclassified Variovorax TaxID=663243 RepID=UPI00076D26A6|nr:MULTISPECIES: ABC transporter ATP-binding protein [unclassified Variovorax]KWT97282.1 Oligopeptide/dipeptide ABC transporter, ATP-binding protein-like protein [Variovorax sp. WDL1]PNG56239.1 Oligopeptide transport ATP-binding protein OppD [Variovorax sp. B4]PNG57663.1 Oligopeptide transport ATP-binding protein OppD [Variovorax sp. B2]VTV09918.1 Stage 0 sporulation protein KD [Variovorax sp. WDL1]
MTTPTLIVEGLQTRFFTRAGIATAVDEVSFTVHRGQVMGLVGESGSGKSMTGYSMLGLVDAPGRVTGGKVLLTQRDGEVLDLLQLSPRALQAVRGNRVAMIFQDPMMTLNPVLRIDTQMIEAVRAHHRVTAKAARGRAAAALAKVGIASPHERLLAYPHQFSGGMRQRVAIAIALLNEPDLIIADEPTTALDVTIQGQILAEMQALCRESGTALIWITHDLSVVAGLADTVSVMYAGRIVEQGAVADVLERPRHPYTRGLIASAPSRNPRGRPLVQIPGMTPSLLALPPGCAFQARCARADAACRAAPPLVRLPERQLRCFHPHPAIAATTA